jgi:hypothetical protein
VLTRGEYGIDEYVRRYVFNEEISSERRRERNRRVDVVHTNI